MTVATLGAACGSPSSSRYGGIPSYLPKATLPVNRVVTAPAAQPQLAVQGATVAVTLDGGRVLATAVGPAVPPFVAPPPPAVTATFTVSLAQANGTVPVRVSDFTIRDQTGRLVHPQLVAGEAAPPATVPPGGHVTLQLTAVLPTGEGLLRWTPQGSPLVSWDFVVEND